MFDLIDAPARILSYQDAGMNRDEARRLTRLDMQSAAADVLSADYAQPVSVEVEELGEVPAGHYIEERPGVNRRCEGYCDVAPFCEQYQRIKSTTTTTEPASNDVDF